MPTIWLYPGLSPANNVELTDPTTLSTPPASVTLDSTVALPFNGLGSWLTEDLGQEWLTEIAGEAWLVEVNHLAEFANVIDATVTASAETSTSGALVETIPSTVTATAETATAGSLAETLTSSVTASAETGSASVAVESLSVAVTASAETASDAVAEESLAASIEASAETGSDSLADAVEPPPPEPAPEEEGIGIVALDWPRPKRRSRPPAPEPRYVPWLDPYVSWLEIASQTPTTAEPAPTPAPLSALVGKPGTVPVYPEPVSRETPRWVPTPLVEPGMADLVDRMLDGQAIWEAMQRQRAIAAELDDEETILLLLT